jgi:hypothetical protein
MNWKPSVDLRLLKCDDVVGDPRLFNCYECLAYFETGLLAEMFYADHLVGCD